MTSVERPPQVGEEGGYDWVLAGELGAMLGAGDRPILLTLRAFAVACGIPEDVAAEAATDWLPLYRGYLKSRGVANA